MIQYRIFKEKGSIKEVRRLKRVIWFVIILAGIYLPSLAYPALTRSDMDVLTQVFQSSDVFMKEIEPILMDHRLALHPEILNQKGTGVNYLHPRFGLLCRSSIRRGRQVLKENSTALKSIEAAYGVPREVLVAIYRVETNLGKNLGQYRVINSLLTLTVMVNRRSPWAAQELIALMTLCKNNQINPFSIRGSSAGAFGLCQFVPSSYLAYGTDGNGDGVVDLFDFSDAMASTANYLRLHGWHNRDREKQFRAILAYNRCEKYAKAVLTYSKQVKLSEITKSNRISKHNGRQKVVMAEHHRST